MIRALGRHFVHIAYVGFLGLILFAALDYGLTRPDSHPRFQLLSAIIFGLWIAGCILGGRLPRTGWLPWIAPVGLVCMGLLKVWSESFFAYHLDNATDIAIEATAFPKSFWGIFYQMASVDSKATLNATLTSAALLGGFLLAIEMWRNFIWGKALLLAMVLTGATITILFFLQKIVGGPFQLENLGGGDISFFTYNYWGNGASFLNLFWPPALAVAVYAAVRQTMWWPAWSFIPLTILAANFVNISKAGNVLAAIGVAMIFLLIATPLWRGIIYAGHQIRAQYVIAVAIPLVIIGALCYQAIPWQRWEHYLSKYDGVETDTRYRANAQFVRMIPDAGATGMGPGTFQQTHLNYLKRDPKAAKAPFWVAHQDYIQTMVEWGWVGTLLWGLVFIPGSLGLLISIFREPDFPPPPRKHYGLGIWDPFRRAFLALPPLNDPILAAGLVTAISLTALHAIVDFPMQVPSLGLYFLIWIAAGWGRKLHAESIDDDE